MLSPWRSSRPLRRFLVAETPPRLVSAQWAALERLRARTAAVAAAQWVPGEKLPLDVVVSTVLAGQRAMVAQTDAGLSLAAGVVTRTDMSPLGIEADRLIGARARNGTSLETVYSRTAKVARQDGFARGVAHLRQNIYMDMQLAQRRAADAHVQADRRVTAWRRQTSGVGKTCGFCIAASTRIYHRGDLLPLHPSCRCTVAEIYVDSFQGNVLDRDRLNAVYEQTGFDTSRQALGRVRLDAADLPAGTPVEVVEEIRALDPFIRMDPELGPFLDGNRHDSAFALA